MSEHKIIQQSLMLLIDKERRNNKKLQERVAALEQENHRLELQLKELRHDYRMQTQKLTNHMQGVRRGSETIGRDFSIRNGEDALSAWCRLHGQRSSK